MNNIISIFQIIVSIVLVILILLQERSAGLSGVFGGGETEFYQKRRGLERMIFSATIILVIVFAGLSLLNLVVK